MRIAESVRRKVIEIDRRYRSSWDVRAIAYVTGISPTSAAKILKQARGPRPKKAKRSHDRRTRFLFRDVMWSSDFKNLPGGRKLLKTLDEMSRYKLGWDVLATESATAAVLHGEELVERMGRAPLVWKYDHGSPFTSELFQAFLDGYDIIPFPIPPRAPWANGRCERDNQDLDGWLLPLEGKEISLEELKREVDEGMLMINYVKPRAVLGFRRSAEVYFSKEADGIAEIDRECLKLDLEDIKCQLGSTGNPNERIHRRAVRKLLAKWSLYEEWEEMPRGAKFVNRTDEKNVAF